MEFCILNSFVKIKSEDSKMGIPMFSATLGPSTFPCTENFIPYPLFLFIRCIMVEPRSPN